MEGSSGSGKEKHNDQIEEKHNRQFRYRGQNNSMAFSAAKQMMCGLNKEYENDLITFLYKTVQESMQFIC